MPGFCTTGRGRFAQSGVHVRRSQWDSHQRLPISPRPLSLHNIFAEDLEFRRLNNLAR